MSQKVKAYFSKIYSGATGTDYSVEKAIFLVDEATAGLAEMIFTTRDSNRQIY